MLKLQTFLLWRKPALLQVVLRVGRHVCVLFCAPFVLSSCATYESWPGGSRSEREQPPAPVVREAPAPVPSQVPEAIERLPEIHAPTAMPVVEPPPGPAGFLLEQAERQRKAGDLTAAATSIERAMRIQPGNPWLSLKLGELRLEQGNARQAEVLAQRALAQAGKDRRFASRCWRLTAQAREQAGDAAGAAEAAARADP